MIQAIDDIIPSYPMPKAHDQKERQLADIGDRDPTFEQFLFHHKED